MKTSASTKGIIAAGHRETARAGQIILQQGGNAFDAALAAVFASFVCEPSLTSLGGGGFMNCVQGNGSSKLYDFFVQTPHVRKPLEEVEFVESQINFGTTVQPQYIGRGSAAVYGCPAGIWHIHKQLGSMPLREIAAPALKLCKEGVLITPYQGFTISILEPVVLFGEESSAVFGKNGRLIQEGEIMYRPLLKDTLEAFCEEGSALFYEGELAQRYAKDSRENGGSLTLTDLQQYQLIERNPLQQQVGEHVVLTNPPPSAGGSMIAHGLSLLDTQTLGHPWGEDHVRIMAQTMREMEIFRSQRLDLLGSTTQVSVIDAYGNAASVTTTLGGASGCNIPGTGVPTNNMLGETDLHPGGLYQWKENQRVTSMMSPTIVLHQGRPVIVTGSGGSSRIRSAILQVLNNMIRHKMEVEAAVSHPRLHWEMGVLNIEPGLLFPNPTFQMPDTRLIEWEDKSMFFGGVHTVVHKGDGLLDGFADPRRDGAVAVA